MIHFKETQFGFEWGSMKLERCTSDKKDGWIVMQMFTPKSKLQIYVTRTGKVRVFNMKTGLEVELNDKRLT